MVRSWTWRLLGGVALTGVLYLFFFLVRFGPHLGPLLVVVLATLVVLMASWRTHTAVRTGGGVVRVALSVLAMALDQPPLVATRGAVGRLFYFVLVFFFFHPNNNPHPHCTFIQCIHAISCSSPC